MEQDEMIKSIIRLMYCREYLQYCKLKKPDTKFVLNVNEILSVRESIKVLESLKNNNDPKKWLNFLKRLTDTCKNDKDFEIYKKTEFSRCEKCGVTPMQEEKCSKFHPDWMKWQIDYAKDWNIEIKEQLKEPLKMIQQKCLNCGHLEYYGSGIDKEPKNGKHEI